MKKRSILALLAVLLCLACVLLLAACNDKAENPEGDDPAVEQTSGGDGETPMAEPQAAEQPRVERPPA